MGRSGDHRRCGRETFYVGLFGWELEDTEADGGALYTVCRLSGDAVSGMYEIAGDVPATSVAPSWLSYVSVTDADCTAARVKQLGGRIVHYALTWGTSAAWLFWRTRRARYSRSGSRAHGSGPSASTTSAACA